MYANIHSLTQLTLPASALVRASALPLQLTVYVAGHRNENRSAVLVSEALCSLEKEEAVAVWELGVQSLGRVLKDV